MGKVVTERACEKMWVARIVICKATEENNNEMDEN